MAEMTYLKHDFTWRSRGEDITYDEAVCSQRPILLDGISLYILLT